MPKSVLIANDLDFDYDKHSWCVHTGWQMGRLEFIFRNQSFDPDTNRMLAQAQSEILSDIKPIFSAKGLVLHDEAATYQEMSSALTRDLQTSSGKAFSFFMIGMACFRISAGMGSQDSKKKEIMLGLAKSCIMSIPRQYLQGKDELFGKLVESSFSTIIEVTDFLSSLAVEGAQDSSPPADTTSSIETYVDFDLHIAANGHEIARSPEGESTSDISVTVPSDIQQALAQIQSAQIPPGLLKQTGRSLYNWLFPSQIHAFLMTTEAVARHGRAKLRLRLRIEADAIASLPLELLYREIGGYYMATNPDTVLSRYLDLPLPPGRVRSRDGPIHMLVIVAAPMDQPRIYPNEWEKLIRTALQKPLADGTMSLQVVKKATRKEIRNALLVAKPDIVQFVGHGIYANGQGRLALVDEKQGDGTWLVDDERFASLFMGFDDNLGLISLATCESAKSDSPQGFSGIAPQLVQRGTPAVVAMQYVVLVDTAKTFLETFYASVAAKKPIDWAVQSARNNIALESGLDNREFATPVLYMRAQDGKVF